MKSSKSQNQTFLTLCIDDRTGKYSAPAIAASLTTDAQRTANVPVGGIEDLFLLAGVFLLLLSATEE